MSSFPDYHDFPDRDKGEESFWPSFTDIMMVITMVFLLVTVMVITNNWKLVTDLQKSIQAQRLAAETALDKEAKNHSLEDRMLLLERRLATSQKALADKQVSNEDLQAEIDRTLKNTQRIQKKLSASLALSNSRESQLSQRDAQIENLTADRDKQLATLQNIAEALTALQNVQESSQDQVLRLQAALKEKQTENATQMTALAEKLKTTESSLLDSQQTQQVSEKQLQAMRDEFAVLQAAKDAEAANLATLQNEIAAIRESRSEDVSKLQSLQGEFDSLDSKYQKLLRPARSSEGKHVVSVWFSKQSGREVYRLRDAVDDQFKTTSRKAMASTLAALKDKHGKDLYVKVIIPEKSALSYSEAWRFTTEMQRAYDYYYQDE